jgi:hypothetical protein
VECLLEGAPSVRAAYLFLVREETRRLSSFLRCKSCPTTRTKRVVDHAQLLPFFSLFFLEGHVFSKERAQHVNTIGKVRWPSYVRS